MCLTFLKENRGRLLVKVSMNSKKRTAFLSVSACVGLSVSMNTDDPLEFHRLQIFRLTRCLFSEKAVESKQDVGHCDGKRLFQGESKFSSTALVCAVCSVHIQ